MSYGTLNTDIVQSSTAGTPPLFYDGNSVQIGTLCRAWGSYAYTSNTTAPTLRSSFNISSITRNSQGNYTFAFSTALADANYSVNITGNNGGTAGSVIAYSYSRSASSFIVSSGYVSNTTGSTTVIDYGFDISVFR